MSSMRWCSVHAWVRRLSGGAALLALGCASPGMPPGGPPDSDPPVLVSISPDSSATNAKVDEVVIRFDEVISERPGTPTRAGAAGVRTAVSAAGPGQGASTLAGLVLLSPTDGRDRVQWRRTGLSVRPRGGWKPNTAYRVTLLPGVADLRGNAIGERTEFVFSTGPTIPEGTIRGVIFEWAEGRIANGARIEAYLPSDTLLRWVTRTDSLGRFAIRDLAPGAYRLRGFLDGNDNRVLDEREPFDSLSLTVQDSARAELYAFVHDTLGPRLESVEPIDSTALKIRFDRPVALGWIPDTTSLLLLRADSTPLATTAVMSVARFDTVSRAAKSARDSTAKDSIARDTTARASTAGDSAARPAVARPAPSAGAVRGAARPRAEEEDTLPKEEAPKPNRATPQRDWVLMPLAPITPGIYRIRAVQAEGLAGARRTSEREFRIRAPAVRDTTAKGAAAGRDSTGKRPPAGRDSLGVRPAGAKPAAAKPAASIPSVRFPSPRVPPPARPTT